MGNWIGIRPGGGLLGGKRGSLPEKGSRMA